MISKEISFKLHQWILRRMTEKEKAILSLKCPTALKTTVLGIDLNAKIKNIMETIGEGSLN